MIPKKKTGMPLFGGLVKETDKWGRPSPGRPFQTEYTVYEWCSQRSLVMIMVELSDTKTRYNSALKFLGKITCSIIGDSARVM